MSRREEYLADSTGPGFVRRNIEESLGKTIAKIGFGPEPSSKKEMHHGEWLTFIFSDGTRLELKINSEIPDGVVAANVSLSFDAVFQIR